MDYGEELFAPPGIVPNLVNCTYYFLAVRKVRLGDSVTRESTAARSRAISKAGQHDP